MPCLEDSKHFDIALEQEKVVHGSNQSTDLPSEAFGDPISDHLSNDHDSGHIQPLKTAIRIGHGCRESNSSN
jgi:hypothetical protein